jgi:hypothetical protein
MTTYSFPESTAIAMQFIHSVLSNTLNVRQDWERDDEMREMSRGYYNNHSTQNASDACSQLRKYRLAKVEIGELEEDLNGLEPNREQRFVEVYGIHRRQAKEVRIITFTVFRHYVDGEQASGWTAWQIKRARLFDPTCSWEAGLESDLRLEDEGQPLWLA